ncbi:unnamed protein product [Dovyalis caffra]|uniref:PGG domain-containing protein n=1 Tax=Dovyalis caffra TaxID=77055 RepID=A0AAV1R3Y1_9ROSI|nr:unnamed protein product [Dovyalis caffra]
MAADQLHIPENPSKNFDEFFRFKLGRDPPSDARNTLLVVTTLIAALTFQAGINPPGGVWQEDRYSPENCTVVTAANNCTIIRHAGKAILASSEAAYALFIFANTLAFSAATNTILFLLLDSPFQTEIILAIYSTNFTYGSSIAAVHPPGAVRWEYIFIAFLLPYVLRVFSTIIRRYK